MDAKTLFVVSIVCIALGASAPAYAGCFEEKHGQLMVEAGRGDEVDVGGIDWGMRLAGDCDDWQWRGLMRLALLRGREPPPADRTIWVASFIPSARHRIAQPFGAELYLDAGLGVSALSQTRINSERRLSTAFQFSEFAGFTVEVGGDAPFSLSLRIQHISNGGIKHPNDGITFASLVYSRPF
jgi:hypothetical protein